MLPRVCIFVYVAAERPLEASEESGLRFIKLKQRERRHVLDEEHVYVAVGCACALTLDGAAEEDLAERAALLDALERYLTTATHQGPVRLLVTDRGRERARQLDLAVSEFRDFDFASAWDSPSLLNVHSG